MYVKTHLVQKPTTATLIEAKDRHRHGGMFGAEEIRFSGRLTRNAELLRERAVETRKH